MKPIEKVHIHCPGDPSVGIFACDFEATVWILRDDPEFVEDMRQQFTELYSAMGDDRVRVLFDYEMEALQRQEQEMEDAMGRDEKVSP